MKAIRFWILDLRFWIILTKTIPFGILGLFLQSFSYFAETLGSLQRFSFA
jgi:hypothetical protein